jgi:cell division protease FtsH
MVAIYGFNDKIGNISFYDSTGQRDAGIQKPYGEETGNMIDQEVRKLIGDVYKQAKEILTSNKESLIKVAELLLQKEVIFKEDLESILGKRAVEKKSITVIEQ